MSVCYWPKHSPLLIAGSTTGGLLGECSEYSTGSTETITNFGVSLCYVLFLLQASFVCFVSLNLTITCMSFL